MICANMIAFGISSKASKEYWGLKFTAEEAGSTIAMTKGASAPDVSLLTSRDGNTWTQFIPNETTITLTNVGDYVYFKAGEGGNTGLGPTSGTSTDYANVFTMTGKISASGNIMSLLNGNEQITELTENNSRCFLRLFQDCTPLTKAPELPAETLAIYCYYCMFYGCSSLTKAPALPATTLTSNCYHGMFYNCTSLTQAPELPAETLATRCYENMFYGCTSLTQAPELPAETLAHYRYYGMFRGCSNLSSINVNFTEWNPTNATTNWVLGVKSTGTFICPDELQEVRGTSYIPSRWTIQRK